jgi:hypothetical protein
MSMNWSDERYVRLYARDTPDWVGWEWQARALLPLLLRKVDRAGTMPLGKRGTAGIAALVQLPQDVSDAGIAALLEDGCVVIKGNLLVVRNYLEAQEARQSDKARQAESRARRRETPKCAESLSVDVTTCHTPSPGVTPRHQASQPVTPSRTVPSRTVPSQEATSLSVGTDAPAAVNVADLFPLFPEAKAPAVSATPPEALQDAWNAHRTVLPHWKEMTDKRRKAARSRLAERGLDGPEGWVAVIERVAKSSFCRGGGSTGWRADPDWLLRADTAVKVLEGKYDDRAAPTKPPKDPRVGRLAAEDFDWTNEPVGDVTNEF